LRIGYLVNQYPKVSHSFIRREILALERQGVEVVRMALRGWDADVVDQLDVREKAVTHYVLESGPLPLMWAVLSRVAQSPLRFLAALGLAFRMSRGSDRPIAIHLAYVAEACRIAAWLEKLRIEHLHAHFGTNPAEIACLIAELTGTSFSFTVHGPEEFDRPQALHLGDKIRRASFVVAVSSFGASQLRRWVDSTMWSKIRVVHCGLDDAFLANDAGSSPSGSQIVCVGRLCEQKGQILLLQAAVELLKRGRQFSLVLAGDGEMRGEIEQLIARSDLKRQVRITGWISGEQVRKEILASRALVLPSFAEGLPVVIMEAMALCRPVLSTYIAGIPELVRVGENGWLVPAGDVLQLANALETVLSASDSELALMGARGRDLVRARHSAVTEAARLADHFRGSLSTQ
jgi:glycosyltransferase involved in cell wall biosynthesis